MMKKLMMMTAIAGMAFGAQADIGYKYDLTLQDIPASIVKDGLLKGITCYLVDSTVKGSSQSYGSKGAIMAELTYVGPSYAASGVLKGFEYTVSGYEMSGTKTPKSSSATLVANDDRAGQEGVLGQVTFQVEKDVIMWKDMGKNVDEFNKYALDNIKAYLIATVDDGAGGTVQKEFTLPVTGNGGTVALGSTATYQQVVPEPTSGLLVFLGLAGLMLKRKRAA